MSVIYKGKEYKVKNKKGLLILNLTDRRIKRISDIKGLNALTELQFLKLARNKISEIEGLESLTNLIKLDLSKNPIRTLKDLDNLSHLQELRLQKCKINTIESFKNKDNLRTWIMGHNPIFKTLYKADRKRLKLVQKTEEERNRIGINPDIWGIICNLQGDLLSKPQDSDTPCNILIWVVGIVVVIGAALYLLGMLARG